MSSILADGFRTRTQRCDRDLYCDKEFARGHRCLATQRFIFIVPRCSTPRSFISPAGSFSSTQSFHPSSAAFTFVRAFILHNAFGPGNRCFFFYKIRKLYRTISLLSVQFFPHFFEHIQKMQHCYVGVVLMEHFYKARHMSTLKIVRKIYKQINLRGRVLNLFIFIKHAYRVLYALYANFLQRNLSCVLFILNITHYFILFYLKNFACFFKLQLILNQFVFSGFEGVEHKHCNCHWAYSARNWCNVRSSFF